MSEGYLERIVPHEMWCARYGPYPQHTGKPCNCPVKIVRELEAENRRLKASVETVTCPFCQESDFDLEGLDNHLYRYCEKYGGMHAQAAQIDKLEAENQRLKAEVEQLRADLDLIFRVAGQYWVTKNALDKLEADNQRLKAEVEFYREQKMKAPERE